jgi:hypothetical protein
MTKSGVLLMALPSLERTLGIRERTILTMICTLLVFGIADQVEYYAAIDAAAAFAVLHTATLVAIWLPAAARWCRAHSGGAHQ